MTSPLAALERPTAIAVLRWVIGVVIVFGLLGCVVKGANNPDDPYLSSPTGAASRTRLADFGETRITVKTTDNRLLAWCLLLAATNKQRARGLMEVTDPKLGGYDGMLFRFDSDVDGGFWMRNTPMPLSIAYVNSAGEIVTTADMEPCSDSPDCRDYPPDDVYRFTIEVPQGNLASLGIVEGATVVDDNTACS